jgi:Xaa-Pro aminopeptidase
MPSLDFADVRHALDKSRNFADVANSGWHADAVYERFSDGEYRRRYDGVYDVMDALGLDGLIVGGGPNHWSAGGGMLWLTGHVEWHAMACYVLVPRSGEPTLVYSMGGTHLEETRNRVWVSDVRPSRMGAFGEVLAEVAREKGLASARIGHPPIDPRFRDYMPVNQYQAIASALPDAELVLIDDIFHDLLRIKSAEELECVRVAGRLCADAFAAMVERARPGATEEDLGAAAASAIYEGGGDVDFLIIGSTSTHDPHAIFGSPHPSKRVLRQGDVIVDELAAGYRGYTAQIGLPIFVGDPDPSARQFFEEITLPGYLEMAKLIKPGTTTEEIREAGQFFRRHGHQSRPILLHGIDLVTGPPHIFVEHTEPDVLEPGQVLTLEPTPVRADGNLGMFFGHTYIVTETGSEMVTRGPLEMVVTE